MHACSVSHGDTSTVDHWTCQACGCFTNTVYDLECGVCGTYCDGEQEEEEEEQHEEQPQLSQIVFRVQETAKGPMWNLCNNIDLDAMAAEALNMLQGQVVVAGQVVELVVEGVTVKLVVQSMSTTITQDPDAPISQGGMVQPCTQIVLMSVETEVEAFTETPIAATSTSTSASTSMASSPPQQPRNRKIPPPMPSSQKGSHEGVLLEVDGGSLEQNDRVYLEGKTGIWKLAEWAMYRGEIVSVIFTSGDGQGDFQMSYEEVICKTFSLLSDDDL